MKGTILTTLDPDKTYWELNTFTYRVRPLTVLRQNIRVPNYWYVLDTMFDKPERIYLPNTPLYESRAEALQGLIDHHQSGAEFWTEVLEKEINRTK